MTHCGAGMAKKSGKIPLNAGFGCPNRDGTCGTGGCTYCSGQKSGDFGGDPSLSLESQFHQMKAVFEKKWPGSRYIAYFQAGTNTYAPVDVLRETFEPVLAFPGVVGLAVATRPTVCQTRYSAIWRISPAAPI